ncbi:MAG: DUF4349 domain-containing protein [Saonia sp.]
MKLNIFMGMLLSSASFLMTQCNSASEHDTDMIIMEDVAETTTTKVLSDNPDGNILDSDADLLQNLKIIKNAQCRFKVTDVDSIVLEAKKIITAYNGYVSDMRFKNTQQILENRFTVRVPQEHFEAVLEELSQLAEFVDYKNITSTNVSEEYVDLQTRLQTKLEVKKRYDDILRSKAKTVKEILLAEEKLRVLQEEIEAAQGRLKFLGNKVALSSIQVDLYETVQYKEEPKAYTKTFGSKIKDSLAFGWNVLEGLFLALLHIWPLILIAIGIVFYIRYRRR